MSDFRDRLSSLGKEPDETPDVTPDAPDEPSVQLPASAAPPDAESAASGVSSSPADDVFASAFGGIPEEDIEDADFTEDAAPAFHEQAAAAGPKAKPLRSAGSNRRKIIYGFLAAAAGLLLAVVVLGGGSKNAATTTTQPPPATGTTPAQTTATATDTGPTQAPAQVETTTTKTATTQTTTTTGGFQPDPTVQAARDQANEAVKKLGLPTDAEKAAANHAVNEALQMIALHKAIKVLIESPASFQRHLALHYGYRIHVIGKGTPRPFIGKKMGELQVTFAREVGFILVYAAAGKAGIPVIKTVPVPKSSSSYRWTD